MEDIAVSLAGQALGGFRLLHQLGAGGGGVVYLAQQVNQPAELVAIKVFGPGAIPDASLRQSMRARFLREAEATRRLRHPHIVPILAAGEERGHLYMALPFMPGGSLAARIGAFPRGMPLDEVAADLDQLASAIDHAHRHDIVHRDIKPTNILLDTQGRLVLADFGIARLLADEQGQSAASAALTMTGQALGSPQYMAPEQVSGQRVGPAADIYALGVTLYQMVAGAPPFTGATPWAVAMMQLHEPPAPLHPQRADLPATSEAAILRALAKRPEDRFTSASALAEEFSAGLRETNPALPLTASSASISATRLAEDVAADEQVTAPDAAADRHPKRHTARRGGRRRVALGALLVALTLAVIAAALLGQRLSQTPQASSGAHFVDGRAYTYNTVIGHSVTTSLTNSDVNVTLISLRTTATQGTVIVVGFDDFDASKGANFLFRDLSNVYLLDQHGVRYAGHRAAPDEVIMNPGQQATTALTFAPLPATTETVALHFNTDHDALAVPCIQISPTAATAGCPS
jgi:serine/threonine-protein kinase